MVFYLYPLFVGILCSALIFIGIKKRNKKFFIFFSILPCFFASPMYTITRGAAGAITASDITGFSLIVSLFFMPASWKTPYGIWPMRLIALWMIVMGISIWTSGVYNNYWGVSNVQLEHLRMSNKMLLPVLIAGYRFVKLLTLYAYLAFFSILFLSAEDRKWLMRAVIMGCIILSVAKLLTALNMVDLSLAYGDIQAGYTGPRILGQTKACAGRLLFIGIIVCLANFRADNKIVGVITLMVLSAGLVLTSSRGALGALFISLIPIFLMGRMRGLFVGGVGFIIIIIAGLFVIHTDKSVSQKLLRSFDQENIATASKRVPIWNRTIEAWLDNPAVVLFGVGAFNFAYAGLSVGYETAHNDILTIGSELGLTAMMVFIAWNLSMAILLYKNIKITSHENKWKNICVFAIFIGLVFAGQFEATFYPTISTLPMSRIILPLLLSFSLYPYKHSFINEKTQPV